MVCVRAEKVNPHGGANKNLVGLYSVSAKKWIVPLAEGSLSFTAADGLVYVTADSKERLIEGYGAEGDGSSDAYSCLMDLQGAIVADAATLAASGADLSADFDGRYLQDGYWLLGEREGGLVAYAENGKVAGHRAGSGARRRGNALSGYRALLHLMVLRHRRTIPREGRHAAALRL